MTAILGCPICFPSRAPCPCRPHCVLCSFVSQHVDERRERCTHELRVLREQVRAFENRFLRCLAFKGSEALWLHAKAWPPPPSRCSGGEGRSEQFAEAFGGSRARPRDSQSQGPQLSDSKTVPGHSLGLYQLVDEFRASEDVYHILPSADEDVLLKRLMGASLLQ